MKKKNIFILSSFLLLFTSSMVVGQTIRYVKPSANSGSDSNDGLSWTTAYATIQKAIDNSSEGDQVWVASGTFHPT